MKIAICDDNEEVRTEIAQLVRTGCPGAGIDCFSSGEGMICSGNEYDVIFLDIEMDGLSGLETARRVREKELKKSAIVFITAYKAYMQEAFDVNAFHYLVKPIDREKFAEVLSRAVSEVSFAQSAEFIVIKTNGRQQKIILHDIYYIESSNKKAVFHTKEGVLETYGKMEELELRLGDGFYRCHRCFLVNMESICSYGCDEIGLINGEKLILAKRKFPDFVKAYLRYAKKGGAVNV